MRRVGLLFATVGMLAGSLLMAECWAQDNLPFIGEYQGAYKAMGHDKVKASALVVSEGPDLYRVVLQITTPEVSPLNSLELHAQAAGARANISGISNGVWWRGEIADETLSLARIDNYYGGEFSLERIHRQPPTLGQAPPTNAIVLLPFHEGTAPNLSAWDNTEWKALADGSMQVVPGKGVNVTHESFGDIRLHLEFNLPHMPSAFGQARSNSGCYLQSRYEVQILDSFGVHAGAGDCGAIYGVAAPRVNASLPPGQWQTYDIEFRANRFKEDGSVLEPATMTVRHNGILIHDNVPLLQPGTGGAQGDVPATAPLLLQDHGQPVRFRNIWLVELD